MSKFTLLSVLMIGSSALYVQSEPINSSIPGPKMLNVKVFIEGAYNDISGTMNTVLNDGAVIPLAQPYNVAPWNYSGTESVAAIPAGVVDWVIVELRDAATPADAVLGYNLPGWPKVFFLKSDGSIVSLDGASMPNIGTPFVSNNLFVVVRHRNHMAILSSSGAILTGDIYSYDFTTGQSQAYGGAAGYKMVGSKAVMVAGDIDHDENIFVSDYNFWASDFGADNQYSISDLDMDRNVFVSDYNKWASNFGSTTGVGAGQCSFTDSRDGREYKCVKIGTQTWMAENLAYLPSVNPYSASSNTTPYNYVYGYDGSNVSAAKATANYSTYGVLYNWPAAMAACPSGWHLPTDEEWKILEKNQGMSDTDADATGWRNSGNVGGKLKEIGTTHWFSPNTGATNASGFTALPGGFSTSGGFLNLGGYAHFWSASEGEYGAWYRGLSVTIVGVNRIYYHRYYGFSVRCLQN